VTRDTGLWLGERGVGRAVKGVVPDLEVRRVEFAWGGLELGSSVIQDAWVRWHRGERVGSGVVEDLARAVVSAHYWSGGVGHEPREEELLTSAEFREHVERLVRNWPQQAEDWRRARDVVALVALTSAPWWRCEVLEVRAGGRTLTVLPREVAQALVAAEPGTFEVEELEEGLGATTSELDTFLSMWRPGSEDDGDGTVTLEVAKAL
jgi:hypothetical protein